MKFMEVVNLLVGRGVSPENAVDLALGRDEANGERATDIAERRARVQRQNGQTGERDDRRYEPVFPDERENEPAPVRRRRRRNGPQVLYRVTRAALKAAQTGKGPSSAAIRKLFPTAAATMKAVARSKGKGISAAQIESAAGLGKKTVESCLYHLRHAGLVESFRPENKG
jgi:hypothetical protein